jgi:hypothetical protein
MRADTEAAGRGPKAVINNSVAVVVKTVADLRRGSLEGIAGLIDTAHAVLLNVATNTEAAGRGPKAVIDTAVAVVVKTVADLRRGSLEGIAGLIDTTHTVLLQVVANTEAAGRGPETVIDNSVAVVVKTVADLRRGSLEGIAGLVDTANAVLLQVVANTEAAGRGPETVVNNSVAVVIKTVADLRRGSLEGIASLSYTTNTILL